MASSQWALLFFLSRESLLIYYEAFIADHLASKKVISTSDVISAGVFVFYKLVFYRFAIVLLL